ncbi:hypothetical protein MNBD_GAMMA24-153 [hydrothermal vent metagenome]|uniref:Uncharacterized protein n=1 Tax=hydrothermal vent metagenome TaxID=652676 RepID=A0A3B1BLW4_9ZZZZ
MKTTRKYGQRLRRHLHIWHIAWQTREPSENKKTAQGKELEFLPAVLEIQETPASPLGRTMALVIMLLFVLAVIWATLGKIDIIAVAQGKIIPSSHSKTIQPLEAGVIDRIYVHEDQYVNKGDPLVDMDSTASKADTGRLENELKAAQIEAARLRALLAGKSGFTAPDGVDRKIVLLQIRLLKDQLREHQARMASARSLVKQRQAAMEMAQVNIENLEKSVALLEERSHAISEMLAKKYASRMKYLEIEQQRLEKVQALAAEKKKRQQDEAALDEAGKQREAIRSEFYKTSRSQLSDAQNRIRSKREELVKARNRTTWQHLVSPIDGLVQQLAVHTVGGVVTPAQQLMVVVPRKDKLEIEAWVQNKDIGFVDPGQEVEIKVEAFPFTRYGLIAGKVVSLSKDAVPLKDVGYVYAARVSMARTTMNAGDKVIELSPGMNVSVEVKTGKRRVLEFILSPLLRGIQETAHER